MKRRAEARAIYEQALQQGQTASLLEQERPNIFTQSVGNIKPREEIHIEISYVDVLNYDWGYEFHSRWSLDPDMFRVPPSLRNPNCRRPRLEGRLAKSRTP